MRNFSTILFLILLSFITSVSAQTNSWINHSQKYVRVGVSVKGLQKVTFAQLNDANLGLNADNVNRLQLYHRGQEVSIISTDNNEVIFYGELNDGASDAQLYRPQSARMNPYYSMYSDEGAYFFTIGDEPSTRRATNIPSIPINTQEEITWHWEKDLATFFSQHSNATNPLPTVSESYFKDQETFTDAPVKSGENVTHEFNINNRIEITAVSPKLTIMVNGRETNYFNTFNKAKILVSEASRQIHEFSVSSFTGSTATINIQNNDFNSNRLLVDFQGVEGSISRTYYLLEYPQETKLGNKNIKHFYIPPSVNNQQLLTIPDLQTGSNYFVLDISNLSAIRKYNPTINANTLKVILNRETNNSSDIIVASQINIPQTIRAASMVSINPSNYNYYIITNNTLLGGANNFATYRASNAGGSYRTIVLNILDIYDQFNYGDPSPVAIQQFAKHIISDNNKNKYLYLIGLGTTLPGRFAKGLKGMYDNNASYRNFDNIPSIGYPASDGLMVSGLVDGANPNIPEIAIGRLPATTLTQVNDYLDKVKKYESETDNSWKKKVVHISGGKTTGEAGDFRNRLAAKTSYITDGYLGGNIKAYFKSTDPALFRESDILDLSVDINNNVGLVSFFGHSTSVNTDYNFGYISGNNKYIATSKTPLMYFNGCGMANIFAGRYNTATNATVRVALGTDWLLKKDIGAIAVISNTWDSYPNPTDKFLDIAYKYMFLNQEILTIGDIIKRTANDILTSEPTVMNITNIHQTLLQGDPALKLVRIEKPEYIVNEVQSLFLKPTENNKSLGESAGVDLGIQLRNDGRYDKNSTLNVRMNLIYAGNVNSVINTTLATIPDSRIVYLPLPSSSPGARVNSFSSLEKIELTINPANNPEEYSTANNFAYLNINWSKAQNLLTWNNDLYTLPVTLKDFVIQLENESVNLKWNTTDEIDSKGFEIQKSYDATNWTAIGFISSNNTPFNNYNFWDTNVDNGTSYYRLKMIDLDESYVFSRIESINIQQHESNLVTLSPNPTSDFFSLNKEITNLKLLEIYSSVGSKVYSGTYKEGEKINISNLTPGLYIVSVQYDNGLTKQFKLIKK